ncbi:hypothetical protein PO124_20895 [Bacillus licheniformis]|nr:hypothetical protein [Bacillus licheniformis]
MLVFKLNLGIDFSSGSRIEVQSDHKLTTQQLERTLNKSGLILTRSFFQAKNDHGVARFVGVPNQKRSLK